MPHPYEEGGSIAATIGYTAHPTDSRVHTFCLDRPTSTCGRRGRSAAPISLRPLLLFLRAVGFGGREKGHSR